jgi:hypothetical protein
LSIPHVTSQWLKFPADFAAFILDHQYYATGLKFELLNVFFDREAGGDIGIDEQAPAAHEIFSCLSDAAAPPESGLVHNDIKRRVD